VAGFNQEVEGAKRNGWGVTAREAQDCADARFFFFRHKSLTVNRGSSPPSHAWRPRLRPAGDRGNAAPRLFGAGAPRASLSQFVRKSRNALRRRLAANCGRRLMFFFGNVEPSNEAGFRQERISRKKWPDNQSGLMNLSLRRTIFCRAVGGGCKKKPLAPRVDSLREKIVSCDRLFRRAIQNRKTVSRSIVGAGMSKSPSSRRPRRF